jgi:hypothetical protein
MTGVFSLPEAVKVVLIGGEESLRTLRMVAGKVKAPRPDF